MVRSGIVVVGILVVLVGAEPLPPELCKWTRPDCLRFKKDVNFSKNCDTKGELNGYEVYSCSEECWRPAGPTFWCWNDYCTGFRENCPQSRATTTTNMTPSARVPFDGNVTQANSTEPDVIKDEKTLPATCKPENRDSKGLVIYMAVIITLILMIQIAYTVPRVVQRFRKQPRESVTSPTTFPDADSRQEPTVKYEHNNGGKETAVANIHQRTAAQSCQTDGVEDLESLDVFDGEKAKLLPAALPKLKSFRKRHTSTGDSSDQEMTPEHENSLDVRQLNDIMLSLQRLLKSQGRQRRHSTSLTLVDECTDNDDNMIDGLRVSSTDRATLTKGHLSETMLTAVLRVMCGKFRNLGKLRFKVELVSFNQKFPGSLADRDVIFWPRMASDPQPAPPPYYLVIVEVKSRRVHICDPLNDTAFESQKRLIRKEEALRGFDITNNLLTIDRHGIDSGLCTVMYVDQYLSAAASGFYQPGQTEAFHFQFLTAKGTNEPTEYRRQLRNMITDSG